MNQNPNTANNSNGQTSLAALRRFVRPRAPLEQCDICGAGILEDHAHLFEPTNRQVVCACDECAVSVGEQEGTPYRRVPRRVRALPDFNLSDSLWEELLIPVGMAFFFYNTPSERVLAYYPSPAGATESLLTLEAWEEVVRDNPVLNQMEPDVEALLVNRLKGAQDYYLVPIDKCYELVGIIRAHWRGLSGGSQVWDEIGAYYARLKRYSVESGNSLAATQGDSSGA